MKIIIDEKVCTKHKMTLSEVLFALAFRTSDKNDNIANMMGREILTDKAGIIQVTQHWSDVLDKILADSGNSFDDNRLQQLAEKIQECYPSGFKLDERTGTKYYHKSNKTAIKQALKKFITYFGDYPDDEIIDATKRYVASFKGNYRAPFQMAHYFVCKDLRNKGGDITSPLATFLENKEDGEDEIINGDILAQLV